MDSSDYFGLRSGPDRVSADFVIGASEHCWPDPAGEGRPGCRVHRDHQLGTETAVLIFFWRDIVRIVKAWFGALAGRVPRNDPDARMGWLIIIGSLPIGVLGLLLEDYIDTQFRSLWIVATMLIVFAVFLGLADRFGREQRELKDLTFRHGLLYGCAQALALIPGVSRSGGTITAGLFMGYTREAAARYSFLLAMPAVFMSGLYKTFKVVTGEEATGFYGMPSTIVATLVAFCGGLPDDWLVPEVRVVEVLRHLHLVPHCPGYPDFCGSGYRRAERNLLGFLNRFVNTRRGLGSAEP